MERQPKEPEMEREVRVKLTDAEIIERAQTLAAKVEHIQVLRRQKRDQSRSLQALIEAELDEVERLARVINAQEEMRKQGDLFADQDLARGVLAGVAKAACTCPPEAAALGSWLIDCPVHGEDAPPAASTAALAASLGGDDDDEEDEDLEDDHDEEDDEDGDEEAGAAAPVASAGPRSARGPRGPLKRSRRATGRGRRR